LQLKEYLFRLQVFQQTISTLYTYPLRLYKNDCYGNFVKELEDSGDALKLHTILSSNKSYSIDQLMEDIKLHIKNTPDKSQKEISDILEPYVEKLSSFMWETKASNSLTFTRDIKDNKRIRMFLMLYDLFKIEYIDTHFKEPYNCNCFIGMKNIFVKLTDEYTLCVGRLFTTDQRLNDIIKEMIQKYNFNNMNIFELTKIAKKRRIIDSKLLKTSIPTIKSSFDLFLNSISKLPDDISKEEIEKVSIFIYMITKHNLLESTIVTNRLKLTYKNKQLQISNNSVDKEFIDDNYQHCCNKFESYRDLFRSEYTSRAKNYLNKKYSGLMDDNYIPIVELLKRICNRLNADGGFFIRYNIADDKLEASAPYGDIEYQKGIKTLINSINTHQKKADKSRVLRIIKNYFDKEYKYDIDKLIFQNLERKEILQPVKDKPILSNIAIPVTFRHKLLGVLLIDSFRKDNFTDDDINIILSLSDALSVQIFDQIVEKNLFKIIENVPNQAELTNGQTLKIRFQNLATSINNIFFSYGVAIWSHNSEDNTFTLESTTLPIPDDIKSQKIETNSNDIIWNIIKNNKVQTYNIKDDLSRFICYNPNEYDSRINCVEIHAIEDTQGHTIGALSIYNASKDDYKAIDEQSLKSVMKHLQIFFNIIKTFKEQKELVHKHALHEISSKLNMIKNKTRQLKNILFENFRDIDRHARHQFNTKITDIENFVDNTQKSFQYITNTSDETHKKNLVDDKIERLYKPEQRKNEKTNNIRAIINEVITSIPSPYDRKNIEIENSVDFHIDLLISSLILSDLFENIIINAFKYSFQGTKIKIYSKVMSNSIRIHIKNDGLKIENYEKIDIFKYRYRGFETKNYQEKIDGNIITYKEKENENIGLGLYTSKELMQKVLNGEIMINIDKSIQKNGSVNTFVLVFPKTLKRKRQI
jgi:putative methionine-R-sulfoxide reductase with GAF domain